MEPVKMSKFEICTICTLGNDVACKLTCHDALVRFMVYTQECKMDVMGEVLIIQHASSHTYHVICITTHLMLST